MNSKWKITISIHDGHVEFPMDIYLSDSFSIARIQSRIKRWLYVENILENLIYEPIHRLKLWILWRIW